MNINQTVTRAEINALQNKYKSAFNFNYYYNVVLLLIVIGIAGYNAYNIFFRETELFYCIVSVLYIIASCWVMSILVYNCRIKGTFKYINKLMLIMYDKDSYDINVDDETVTLDEKFVFNWKDFEVVFLCGEYVVLGTYKKLSVILKVTAEERAQICQLMADNKKAIVALDGGKEAVEYNKKAISKFNKKKWILVVASVVVLVIIVFKSITPTFPVENNSSASTAKQDFNPELAFNGQMANALDSEGVTGFNFDAVYMFDMYAEYVKYRFNTAVKEYDNTSADKELWFFDGENTEFGFDIDKSKVAGKSKISYFNDENKVIIEEKNGQPYAAKESYQQENWDDVFADLMMRDYTLSKYPKLETFGGSGSNYFYAKFRDNINKSISYRFGENYVLCEEYRGQRVVDSFIIVFAYKYEDKLDNTEALFDTVLAETEKAHSEQNIDFELLMEEIEKYCDYNIRK